ncbi:STAS domain-containing protein [Streptomyces sp. CWNU-52H]|uniref:STAS domain-containing protein n=1 Tax=Streptomyces sp. CWNU-52H TaxID=3394352 RepID=UPI0039BF872A
MAGVLDTTTNVALERCLADLVAQHRGRVIHVDLTAVTSVSLASLALLVAMDGRAHRDCGELRLRLSPRLERRCERAVRVGAFVSPRR